MERRIALYVNRKSIMTWLSVLCIAASAVLRIVLSCMGLVTPDLWVGLMLPVCATVLFLLIALLNKEMFYKTAIPVWLMGIYYAIRPGEVLTFGALTYLLFCAVLLFFCISYTTITSGKIRQPWLLLFLFAAPLSVCVYGFVTTSSQLYLLPEILLFFGGCLLTFGIRPFSDGKSHPTWGDRIDGRKIRTLAPMAQITAFFQVERNTCSNLFEEAFEITHIDRYIRQKRREGYADFGINHVLLAAYVRGIAKYPQLNRFISGQKVFSRGNDIQYCMVVKKEMTIDSPDTSIKVHLTPSDTAMDVYHKLNAAVEEVKRSQELDSGLDSLIMHLNLIPSVVLKFLVWLLKLLDYFGLLPKFLLELSPFHGSLFFTSMGSLGIPPIYHHLYDFGNIPAFGAFGCKRRALEIQEDGSVVQKKYIDMKFVLDERIVDGFYYATFFKYFRRLLAHPEILDKAPEEVIKDID